MNKQNIPGIRQKGKNTICYAQGPGMAGAGVFLGSERFHFVLFYF